MCSISKVLQVAFFKGTMQGIDRLLIVYLYASGLVL
jgi:hypothetical protein